MLLLWYTHAVQGTPLRRVAGLSLVQRAVLSAQQAGFTRVAVNLQRDDQERVEQQLAQDRRITAAVEVVADAPLPSFAVTDAGEIDPPELALALGDRVWIPAAMQLLKAPLGQACAARIVGTKTDEKSWSGLARVGLAHADQLLLASGATSDQVTASLGQGARLEFFDSGQIWHTVQSDGDIRAAETLLLKALVKKADGLVSRHINRKISLALSRFLTRTRISPNQITAVVFVIGICSGPLAFFWGSYWGFFFGALCYYASAILDGCDGEISRLKYCGSPLGAWLDTIVDDLVCLSYILGLYGRLALDREHPFWLYLGIGTLFFYLLTILPRYYVMVTRIGSGDFQKLAAAQRPAKTMRRGWIRRAGAAIRGVIFRTDFLPFYAFVTAALGFVPAFALPFAAGSIASAADSLVTLFQRSPGATE